MPDTCVSGCGCVSLRVCAISYTTIYIYIYSYLVVREGRNEFRKTLSFKG